VDKPSSSITILILAVLAVSTAAPAIRLGSSPALAVSFWRVGLAAFAIGCGMLASGRKTTLFLSRLAPLAGVLLGLHFWTWIASLDTIPVARSVLLVSTKPVWAAILGRILLKDSVTARNWCGIAIALCGVAVATGGGVGMTGGDLLALAGAVLAAGYMVVGRRERQRHDLAPYLFNVYGWAALTLLPALVFTSTSPWPSHEVDWLVFAFLAAVPTGIGHSLYNYSLKHLPAHVVATTITLEPWGASVFAFFLFGETPEPSTWWAAPLVLLGVWLVVPRTASSSQ